MAAKDYAIEGSDAPEAEDTPPEPPKAKSKGRKSKATPEPAPKEKSTRKPGEGIRIRYRDTGVVAVVSPTMAAIQVPRRADYVKD